MVSTYKREGSFIKLEKGIPITFSKMFLHDGFFLIENDVYRIVTPTENTIIIYNYRRVRT